MGKIAHQLASRASAYFTATGHHARRSCWDR
jgi:hypothetical protein